MSQPITLVLVYSTDKDNFYPIDKSKTVNADELKNKTHLIIDEVKREMILSFPNSSSLIEKRIIERRVNSFLKIGYQIPGEHYRVGAGFPLVKTEADERMPDILMTHGYRFGKEKLIRDDLPSYLKKEQSPDTKRSLSPVMPTEKSSSKILPPKLESISSSVVPDSSVKPPSPSTKPSSREPEKTAIKSTSNVMATSDDDIFALGEFVAMLVSQGNKVLVEYGNNGKFKLKTVKEIQKTETVTVSEKKYFIEGNELFEAND